MKHAVRTALLSLSLAAATGTGGAFAHDAAPQAHAHASTPATASPLTIPLDAAAREGLARERVQATAHGKPLDCEGVSLAALLRAAGALPEGKLPGDRLAHYVLVGARDGYRVLYALAELDPATGHRRVLLVDRCAGAPLDDADGPLRLIAPEDARPARWVRQVQSITVVAAP